ncbi:MAG: cytidylate kinase-like family protein [Lachnospiraceae bacterium]|nr:cytidylate kinase-like family protein [Lachnospiraceae bacterium]
MDKVITINSQYGSGGRELGKKLADKLGIPFYDNELITRAAKESGFAESAFEKAEAKATNSLLYSIAMGMSAYSSQDFGYGNISIDDRIFLAQAEVIRKVASEGPCVIVGRCADYILRDEPNVVNIFCYAGADFRIKRAIESYGVNPAKAAEEVMKYDKRRANYYNYHTSEKWGVIYNYQLSIRTDLYGIDHSVDVIKTFVEG